MFSGQPVVKIVAPGDYVGEMGPLFRIARSETVRARTDAVVAGYSVPAFRQLLEARAEGRFIEHDGIDIKHGNTDDDLHELVDAPLPTGPR
jgi:putative ABC transport system ATP-binding protein